jgi:hypothetical protein
MSQLQTNVNEAAIVSALSQMPIFGNEQGSIPAFGVYLTRMYADYYNKISYRFERALEASFGAEGRGIAAPLLIEAGNNCAFHTFGGIMESDEWYGLIEPMCSNREDWVHGMVAVVNALGWGKWQVQDLVPNERLVIRILNSYESEGHLKHFGTTDRACCYLATGGVSGIMNLLYQGDITTRPDLTPAYYAEVFGSQQSFGCIEHKCRSKGDAYCEFEATRDMLSIHKM